MSVNYFSSDRGGGADGPLAVMSARRIGCREYSLASASRTSFLTICSLLLPSWVSPSSPVSPSMFSSMEEASEAEAERRRRVGGGVGEASAC